METAGEPAKTRRFTLVDGMILVGAITLGLAAIRGRVEGWRATREPARLDAADEFVMLATPLLMAATLALVAMRLRPPRPRWRRLARQPGFVACLMLGPAWGLALGLTIYTRYSQAAITLGERAALIGSLDFDEWPACFSLAASELGGLAVAVAWSTLAMAGRWRAERSWLDRLGRVVGAAWIALLPVGWYVGGGI